MNLSADMVRYFEWAAVVIAGALFAVSRMAMDQASHSRSAFAAGVGRRHRIVTQVSPFTFGTGGYYMEGVLVAAGSALALTGYVFVSRRAAICVGRWGRHGPS